MMSTKTSVSETTTNQNQNQPTNTSDFFPLAEPREQQLQIMRWMDENWDKKKYFLIDAPPGVGKSAVAMAAAARAGRAYFLTSTKALQDQYLDTFDWIANLKGKDNYDCGINPAFRVSAAPCAADGNLKFACMNARRCPYYTAREEALGSTHMVTSYAYQLMAVECGPLKDRSDLTLIRDIMVCDEAHEIDSIMADFLGFQVDPMELKSDFGIKGAPDMVARIGRAKSVDDQKRLTEQLIEEFIRPVIASYDESIRRIMETALEAAGGNHSRMNPAAAKQAKEITGRRDKLDRIYKRAERYYTGRGGKDDEWMLTYDDTKLDRDGNPKPVLIFSPLYSRVGFQDYLARYANRMVLMSASLGDPKTLAREMGIPLDEMVSISVGTPFDPSKSPVYFVPIGQMNMGSIAVTMPKLIDAINGIMDSYPDKKGIIHAGNYRVTQEIMNGLSARNQKRLIGKKPKDRISNEELLERHGSDPGPTVLVSPSMHTGVDLHGDLSRFQIIAKLPWPSLEDPRIKKKGEEFSWYANEMLKRLIQSSGRSTRNIEDSSDTYLLDSGFEGVWKRSRSLIPRWFAERLSFG